MHRVNLSQDQCAGKNVTDREILFLKGHQPCFHQTISVIKYSSISFFPPVSRDQHQCPREEPSYVASVNPTKGTFTIYKRRYSFFKVYFYICCYSWVRQGFCAVLRNILPRVFFTLWKSFFIFFFFLLVYGTEVLPQELLQLLEDGEEDAAMTCETASESATTH